MSIECFTYSRDSLAFDYTLRKVTSVLGSERLPSAGPKSRSPLYVLIVLTALNAFNHLDRQLMSILLEPIRREFALSDIQLGLLSGPAFAIVYTLLGFPAAIWAAHRCKVNLIAGTAVIWGTATAACGLAQSFGQLLLGRLGVGIGEAGVTPAAQTLVSNLYETSKRATAMSVFTAGINAGVFFAFLIGGVVGQAYGWRSAFVATGVATVLFGCFFRLIAREATEVGGQAKRSASTGQSAAMIGDTLRHIWADPALLHVCVGATLTSTVGYGVLAWLPSFLVRAHGLDIAKAGLFLAVVLGVGGAVGTWIGGVMSDRLRARDIRWSLWFVALVFLAAKPLSIGSYLIDNTSFALALLVLPGMAGAIFLGPSVATLHNRVPAALRPVASAVFLFFVNLVGLGLGPLLVGVISEHFFSSGGTHSIGYALIVMQILGAWGVVHYYVAGQRLAPSSTKLQEAIL